MLACSRSNAPSPAAGISEMDLYACDRLRSDHGMMSPFLNGAIMNVSDDEIPQDFASLCS